MRFLHHNWLKLGWLPALYEFWELFGLQLLVSCSFTHSYSLLGFMVSYRTYAELNILPKTVGPPMQISGALSLCNPLLSETLPCKFKLPSLLQTLILFLQFRESLGSTWVPLLYIWVSRQKAGAFIRLISLISLSFF